MAEALVGRDATLHCLSKQAVHQLGAWPAAFLPPPPRSQPSSIFSATTQNQDSLAVHGGHSDWLRRVTSGIQVGFRAFVVGLIVDVVRPSTTLRVPAEGAALVEWSGVQ